MANIVPQYCSYHNKWETSEYNMDIPDRRDYFYYFLL